MTIISWHTRQALDEAAARFGTLTPREKAVMELIAAGNHTKKIAAHLDIQDRTVDVHRFNIMRKVGVRTLAELLRLWSDRPSPDAHVEMPLARRQACERAVCRHAAKDSFSAS